MIKIVLISCVKTKLQHKSKAEDLYISPLFKLSLKYAKSLSPDKIFILSAKYGLLGLNEEIEPYDLTLNKMLLKERKLWAERVIEQLKKVSNLQEDKFIFLTGKRYREYLIPHIKNSDELNLSMGNRLKFLKEKTK